MADKAEYSAAQVTDQDTDPEDPGKEVNTDVKQPLSYNICDACKEFGNDPFTNWKSGLFLVFGILSIVFVFFSVGGFIGTVAVCVAMSLFAIFDFRDIFYLAEQIEVYDQLNERFKDENAKLKESNNLLHKETSKFKGLTTRFREDIDSLQKNINKMEQLVKEINADDTDDDDKKRLAIQKTTQWIHTWRQNRNDNVRRVIQSAADAISKNGFTKEQFQQFMQSLPTDYKTRIETRYPTFADVDGDVTHQDDGSIDLEEFKHLLNAVCCTHGGADSMTQMHK